MVFFLKIGNIFVQDIIAQNLFLYVIFFAYSFLTIFSFNIVCLH